MALIYTDEVLVQANFVAVYQMALR